MTVQQLLSLVPDRLLERLALQTGVDHYAKKLQGEVLFKLLLHCLLTHKDNSLRGMASAYESLVFRLLNRDHHRGSIAIASISERLNTIPVTYFEQLYLHCVGRYKQRLGPHREEVTVIDSTIVALSTKLLQVGYHLPGGDADRYRQLKFTIAYSNGIAETVSFYTDQPHNSENLALRETILKQAATEPTTIKIFDQGVTARHTYDALTEGGMVFISLLNPKAKHDIIEPHKATRQLPVVTQNLAILGDQWCQLYGEKKKATYLVRRIEAVRLPGGEPLVFITNAGDLSAYEVTELYSRRWGIEVFFRFIKQLLNFRHLLNRSENGIQVVLYVTLIAAVLLEAYKRHNSMNGYKIPMQRFATELEEQIIQQLITWCGGDVHLLKTLTPDSS